ncbi:hypothetical protein ACWCXC_22110 [Streptomyces sp. NPDC001515]
MATADRAQRERVETVEGGEAIGKIAAGPSTSGVAIDVSLILRYGPPAQPESSSTACDSLTGPVHRPRPRRPDRRPSPGR